MPSPLSLSRLWLLLAVGSSNGALLVATLYPDQISLTYIAQGVMVATWATGDYVMGKSPLPRANSNVASNVIYGTRSGQLTQMANGTSLFYEQNYNTTGAQNYTSPLLHHVPITGLQPSATYFYKVGDASLKNEFNISYLSPELNFTTPPAVGSASSYPQVEEQAGNLRFASYSARWGLPYASTSSNSTLYYSFEVGAVHFITLSAYVGETSASDQEGLIDGTGLDSEQYNWLLEDLATVNRTKTPWVIVGEHAPWYHSYTTHWKEVECMRKAMEQLLYDNGVDIFFSGHIHAYERTNRVFNYTLDPCGIAHIMVGDGGDVEGLSVGRCCTTPNVTDYGQASYSDMPGNCPKPIAGSCATNFTDGTFCGANNLQYEWSAFREISYGYGTLDIINSTVAVWQWHRNQASDAVDTIGDELTIVRTPQSCPNQAGGHVSAPSALPAAAGKTWTQYGLQQALAGHLWDTLKQTPGGSSFSSIMLAAKAQADQVRQVLQQEPHFCSLPGDKWGLAAFQPLRWGFAGTGLIAEDFIEALSLVPGAQLAAVAARNPERVSAAQNFADMHGVKQVLGSYEELAQSPAVDVVYVSNIHTLHKETVLLMLRHRKHVLCEKPLAVNAADTQSMVDAAAQSGLFFAAGLWTRFFPATQMLRQLIAQGTIGEVQHFQGTFVAHIGEETSRLYNLNLGGGALLDIGIYPITMASWIFGRKQPSAVKAQAVLHKSGVDVTSVVNLKFGENELASLSYSIALASAPVEGTVFGTNGRIHIHDALHHSTRLSVQLADKDQAWVLDFPLPERPARIQHGKADGFNFGGSLGMVYEAMAVHAHVLKGRKEVSDVTHKEMVSVMHTLDSIRQQIGVTYPQDGPASAPRAAVQGQPSYFIKSLMDIAQKGPPAKVLASAKHVVLYDFQEGQWRRKDVEGSMFLIQRRSSPLFQIVILNKKSQDNFVEDLTDSFKFEISGDYLLYNNKHGKIVGVWFCEQGELQQMDAMLGRIFEMHPSFEASRSGRVGMGASSSAGAAAGAQRQQDASSLSSPLPGSQPWSAQFGSFPAAEGLPGNGFGTPAATPARAAAPQSTQGSTPFGLVGLLGQQPGGGRGGVGGAASTPPQQGTPQHSTPQQGTPTGRDNSLHLLFSNMKYASLVESGSPGAVQTPPPAAPPAVPAAADSQTRPLLLPPAFFQGKTPGGQVRPAAYCLSPPPAASPSDLTTPHSADPSSVASNTATAVNPSSTQSRALLADTLHLADLIRSTPMAGATSTSADLSTPLAAPTAVPASGQRRALLAAQLPSPSALGSAWGRSLSDASPDTPGGPGSPSQPQQAQRRESSDQFRSLLARWFTPGIFPPQVAKLVGVPAGRLPVPRRHRGSRRRQQLYQGTPRAVHPALAQAPVLLYLQMAAIRMGLPPRHKGRVRGSSLVYKQEGRGIAAAGTSATAAERNQQGQLITRRFWGGSQYVETYVFAVFMDIANLLHFGFLLTWFVRGLEHQRFEWIFSW
eukprot:jgi/Astpho2/7273/fgenesh1_pg.00113_%23_79_t